MAKKRVLVLVLAMVGIAGGVFALPEFKLSAGGGGYFTNDFGGGVETGDPKVSYKTPYAGGGGFVFFDATYAEVDVGFFGGGGKFKMESGSSTTEVDTSYMGLDIGLLAKYPFALGEKFTLSPLLGITYRFMLSAKMDGTNYQNSDGDDAPGDFSALWIRLGGGLDYSLTSNLFLRGQALYGLRLENGYEYDHTGANASATNGGSRLLGHGLEVRIAAGYRF